MLLLFGQKEKGAAKANWQLLLQPAFTCGRLRFSEREVETEYE
jgi:hypothetical protein